MDFFLDVLEPTILLMITCFYQFIRKTKQIV